MDNTFAFIALDLDLDLDLNRVFCFMTFRFSPNIKRLPLNWNNLFKLKHA